MEANATTSYYDIGFDPGARNTAVACSNDAVFQPCVLDLGPLTQSSDRDVVDILNHSLISIFSDPALRCVICEAGETAAFAAQKDFRVSARLFLIQGALQTLSFVWNKDFRLIRPAVWKRAYNNGIWKSISYEANKQWSVDKAVELFGEQYRRRIHHACEAKLLSEYVIRYG